MSFNEIISATDFEAFSSGDKSGFLFSSIGGYCYNVEVKSFNSFNSEVKINFSFCAVWKLLSISSFSTLM